MDVECVLWEVRGPAPHFPFIDFTCDIRASHTTNVYPYLGNWTFNVWNSFPLPHKICKMFLCNVWKKRSHTSPSTLSSSSKQSRLSIAIYICTQITTYYIIDLHTGKRHPKAEGQSTSDTLTTNSRHNLQKTWASYTRSNTWCTLSPRPHSSAETSHSARGKARPLIRAPPYPFPPASNAELAYHCAAAHRDDLQKTSLPPIYFE